MYYHSRHHLIILVLLRALRLTLQVWLDAYPEDFRDPPKFTCLQQLREFTRANLPDSDLNIKVGYKLEKMRKEEETKGESSSLKKKK